MYGWINAGVEALVLTNFGEDTWNKIKAEAECTVANGQWVKHKYYPGNHIP